MNIDDGREADLMAPLLGAEPRPPRVDLRQAIGEARRRRRMHRVGGASGVVAAVAVVAVAVPLGINAARSAAPAPRGSGPASQPPHPSASASAVPGSVSCTEQLLPVPDGVTMALVSGGDASGRYLIGRSYPGNKGDDEQPLIWDNGVAHKVPINGADPELVAISTNGTAVGNAFSGGVESAFIYRDGTLSRLGGATNVEATSVNNAGTVAGSRDVDHSSLPVVWRTPTSPAKDLPMPSPSWRGTPSAVLDDGTVIGSVSPSVTSNESRGIVWHPDGTFQLLPLPEIAGAGGINGLWLYNVRGTVVLGRAVADTPQMTVFYPVAYDLTTGQYTDLSTARLNVSAGNSRHWLVGSGPYSHPGALLWTPDTGLVKLPNLTGKPDVGDDAVYVSEDGTVIAGDNTDKHGVSRAVVWRCH